MDPWFCDVDADRQFFGWSGHRSFGVRFRTEKIMNIFFVDEKPEVAARALCDAHVRKMIIETAQMLSTAHRIKLADVPQLINPNLYKSTHVNHPSSKWVRENHVNYEWAFFHWYELCKEYNFRYGKTHATYKKLGTILYRAPFDASDILTGDKRRITPIPLCMPDEYKTDNPVESYRAYYRSKQHTMKIPMKWTGRNKPEWFDD